MKQKSRRMLSLLLALAMCLGLISPYAWAMEVEEVESEEFVSEVENREAAEAEEFTEAETLYDDEATELDSPAKEERTAEAETTTEAEAPAGNEDIGAELT